MTARPGRGRVDFAGLPELVRTFLQVAAGAADVPVTRLLGQSPAGLSATGDHDTRNYYDMIAARQELDLRPRLERLDACVLASAGVEADALSFAFRPLWQLDASEKAAVALSKAQATAVYAGLNLWPASVTADLVRAQLVEDGTYPNAAAVLAGDVAESEAATPATMRPDWAQPVIADYDPAQPRDPDGRWTAGEAGLSSPIVGTVERQENSGPKEHFQEEALAGTLIDKRYDETINITHCIYHTPVGVYVHEHIGYKQCDLITPAPRFD